MSDRNRKRPEIDDGSTNSSGRIFNGPSTGMSGGTVSSSTVAGHVANNINIYGDATVNCFERSSGIVQKTEMTDDTSDNGKRVKTEKSNGTNRSSVLSFYSDPGSYVNKRFVSSDRPEPGTIDYTLEDITEQLEDEPGSTHCLSTALLIPTLGLRRVGKQPNSVTHHFVMITERYYPVVFAVTKSQDDDVVQYLQQLVQSVYGEMKRHGTGPVPVAGESILEENLTHKIVIDKLELHKQSSSPVPVVDIWRRLFKSCAKIRYLDGSEDLATGVETSLKVLDTGPLCSPPTYTTQQGHYQGPDALMTNSEFETSLRIMGSERTLFIETKSRDHRFVFGLEMACRLNQDGGTLFVGNSGKEIPPEVCKEVVSEQPKSFNDKALVLGCRHVVVFVDRKKDLDKYKTILRGGGKLLVFLCENG